MDKGIRHISAIRGDKHWPYRPYLVGLWPCGFFFMVALTSLGACGDGGSGTASASQGVAVTEPPAIRRVARNRTHAVCRAVELGIAEDDMALA